MKFAIFTYYNKSYFVFISYNEMNLPYLILKLNIIKQENSLRVHTIKKIAQDNKILRKEEYISIGLFKKYLREMNKIFITNGNKSENDKEILKILNIYQLECSYIDICFNCIKKNKITILKENYIVDNHKKLCINCAKDQFKNIIYNIYPKIHESSYLFFEKLFLKIKNMKKILSLINISKLDETLTKYDTVSTINSYDNYETIPIKNLNLNYKFKNILLQKNEYLLPVQSLAIKNGLFNKKNLFVVSSTGTGKTLIGELCGINKIIINNKKKMLYIVPLVALANQKYYQFKEKYSSLGLTVCLKTGYEYLNIKPKNEINTSLNSSIIIGTYEGIDYILRSGNADLLGDIDTIIIDEIHMITDDSRGIRIDGLIARLRYLYPSSQYIYLSATIGNPSYFSKKLNSNLVYYSKRPVPIERHVIFTDENKKIGIIINLIKNDISKISSKGYHGQTIIFTNSRKNCHKIASLLPFNAAAYHSGLYTNERKKIEREFISGKINVIVTTAALAAGVDFPASQVIFESLAMGTNWITVQEFLQMSGRSGRPDYHDFGTVVLLPVPGKIYSSVQKETEDEIALLLLSGKLNNEKFMYDENKQLEEVLANISITKSVNDLININNKFFGAINTKRCLNNLKKESYIIISNNNVFLKPIGKIISKYFLSIDNTKEILVNIKKNIDIIDIIVKMNIYNKLEFIFTKSISKEINMNINSNISSIDILLDANYFSKISKKYQQFLINFSSDFIDNKYQYDYINIEENITKKIINLKNDRLSIREIINIFKEKYGIAIYIGDILSYFENIIRMIEAIKKICLILNKNNNYLLLNNLKENIIAYK